MISKQKPNTLSTEEILLVLKGKLTFFGPMESWNVSPLCGSRYEYIYSTLWAT